MATSNQYVSKLDGMFRDLKTSSDEIMTQWVDFVQKTPNLEETCTDLRVKHLTRNYWPLNVGKCNMHDKDVSKSMENFGLFYLVKYEGRELKWLMNLVCIFCKIVIFSLQGVAEIKTNGYCKPYEFTVTSFQMSILVLFNTGPSLTFAQIVELTGIPEKDVNKALIHLVKSRSKNADESNILNLVSKTTKISSKTKFETDDAFEPNDNYTSKYTKISTIRSAIVKPTENMTATVEEANRDREAALDAAIIRVMKQRKSVVFSNLIPEISSHIAGKFPVERNAVMSAVERLLQKNYIDRDPSNKDTLLYVA